MPQQSRSDGVPGNGASSSRRQRLTASQMDALWQSAPYGIIIIDAERRIMECNPTAEHMFELASAAVVGRDLAECLVVVEQQLQLQQRLAPRLQSQRPVEMEQSTPEQRFGFTARRGDGKEFPAELTATRLPGTGTPTFCIYVQDVSERVALEGRLCSMDVAEQQACLTTESLAHRLQVQQWLDELLSQDLHMQDILPALLTKVRQVLAGDNVALLLPTPDGQALTMYLVQGPEEAVAAQVQVPIGHGVAGKIMATGQPMVIHDLFTSEVVTPLLRQQLRSLVGVPLLAGQQAIGVLHVSTLQPRHFSAGEIALLESMAQRITLALKRVKAQEALHLAQVENQARADELEAIFTAMSDAIFVIDAQGHFVRENMAAAKLFQTSMSVLQELPTVGQRIKQTYSVGERDHPLAEAELPYRRILAGETLSGPTAMDLSIHLKNGQSITVNLSGAPIRDAQGQITASVSIVRDVTERRRMERQSHLALDALLEIARIFVEPARDTSETVAITASRRLAELVLQVLGSSRVALTGHDMQTGIQLPLAIVGIPPELEPVWREQISHSNLSDFLSAAQIAQLKLGHPLQLEISTARLQAASLGADTALVSPMLVGTELVGILALDFGRVPHEYTPAEVDLAAAVAQLVALVLERDRLISEREAALAHVLAIQETQERMDNFLFLASHEINTPLTSVKGGVQLARWMLEKIAQENVQLPTTEHFRTLQQALAQTDRQTNRLERLVNDLLDASQTHQSTFEMYCMPTDLVSIVRDVVAAHELTRPDAALILDLPDQPITVDVDADRIWQVLQSLLTNARKFAPLDRSIRVRCFEHSGCAWVTVEDQGPGVPKELQEKIFERFFRIGTTEVLQGSEVGLGLGLYLARQIIEAHHGEMGVHSEVDEGANFWFKLPLIQE